MSLLLGAALLASSATASAHPTGPALPTWRDAPDVLWVVPVAAALALLAGARSRRVLAAFGVVLIALLAYEGAVHSVHHLGTRGASGPCAVEAASTHLSAAADGMPGLPGPPAAAALVDPPSDTSPAPERPAPSTRDRAPPLRPLPLA